MGLDKLFDRRTILRSASASALTLLLSRCQSIAPSPSKEVMSANDFLRLYGPIDRTLGEKTLRQFSGDDHSRPHQILWDTQKYLASKKVEGSEESVPLVVIGGGGSGLFSAYELREFRPVVLEQAARLGGNAKAQSWRGLDYALGSAYIDSPHPGTPMHHFFQELGWGEILTERRTIDPVEYQGRVYPKFWEGETQPKERNRYAKINAALSDLASEKHGLVFPLIPTNDTDERDSIRRFDRYSIHEWLTQKGGGRLPKHLESAVEYYCWSTYAASSKELSAAAALNFLAQESNPIQVGAGGNAALLEKLLQKLIPQLPARHLRTGCLVVQVSADSNSVRVLYEDSKGQLRSIRARAAVLACPKFVVKRILTDIEPARLEAAESLRYRAYMVANILLKQNPRKPFYDLFMVDDGKTDTSAPEIESERKNATDFVLASFAGHKGPHEVLTFYRAFPYDGGRSKVFQQDAFDHYHSRFESQIEREVLPLLGLKPTDVHDIRLTRWGHALPLAEKGLYQGNTIDRLRAPFRNRVFFVEQDNWAYPSLQTGATEAAYFSAQVRRLLKT